MRNTVVPRARHTAPWHTVPNISLPFLLVAPRALTACGPVRSLIAACRSTDRFAPLAQGHGAPFARPVTLGVCDALKPRIWFTEGPATLVSGRLPCPAVGVAAAIRAGRSGAGRTGAFG